MWPHAFRAMGDTAPPRSTGMCYGQGSRQLMVVTVINLFMCSCLVLDLSNIYQMQSCVGDLVRALAEKDAIIADLVSRISLIRRDLCYSDREQMSQLAAARREISRLDDLVHDLQSGGGFAFNQPHPDNHS